MKAIKISLIGFFVFMIMGGGCEITPKEPEERAVLASESDNAVAIMKAKDPTIQKFFDKSYGYAVMPKIFKGAFIAGVAGGKGEVYEQGKMIGYCKMSQVSGGLSIGGEFYREIVFFKDKKDLDKFKNEPYTFEAQVTGVVISAGVAAKRDYNKGMAVFIMADAGLMVDASLGGQKFNYEAKPVLKKVW
jgi:lipid-binding SYLF domain-containing protein